MTVTTSSFIPNSALQLTIRCQSIAIHQYTRSKKLSLKNKKDLGMACHIPPLKKVKEMPLLSLSPIPFKICRLEGWDGTKAG